MAISSDQMRQKKMAQDEAERHARYAQADGSMKKMNTAPEPSAAIQGAERRVRMATDKERQDIGRQDPSPNADIRFEG